MPHEFSADAKRQLATIGQRYPDKKPLMLAALHLAQKEFGKLDDDAIHVVARQLELPAAEVFGVATFYTMFRRQDGGTNTLRVCTNISCMLRGGYEVLAAFEHLLGIKKGEVTRDGKFALVEEECIAACANAPAVVCGTDYYLDVKPDQVVQIVELLKKHPRPESEVA